MVMDECRVGNCRVVCTAVAHTSASYLRVHTLASVSRGKPESWKKETASAPVSRLSPSVWG